MKAFADNKMNVTEIVFERQEKNVGKGENAGYSIFSFSKNVLKRLLSQGVWLKYEILLYSF